MAETQCKYIRIYQTFIYFSDVPTKVKVHMYVNSFDSIRESSMVSEKLLIETIRVKKIKTEKMAFNKTLYPA